MPVTRKEFEAVFPSLVEELVANMKSTGLPQKGVDWYEKNLNYNCLGGKYNRGMSVVDTASILQGSALSEKDFTATATLGWLTELLQACFLVSDDIMDGSITRRGQPCWYRNAEVGMIAINDAFLLESAIYTTLKKRFRSHPAYIDFVELFHDTSTQTETGQLADLLTAPEDHVDLSNFSMDKFSFIVIWKTAFYSFYLPVALALHYLQLATPSNLKQSLDILIALGEYFQAQDDFLDVYGTPEQIGKIGTDIQDNKCSWVVNTAISRASPEQRKILDENYGRKDKTKEANVKQVFQQLQIDQLYRDYEEKRVADIKAMIAKVDETQGLKKEIFESFLAKIYKRSK